MATNVSYQMQINNWLLIQYCLVVKFLKMEWIWELEYGDIEDLESDTESDTEDDLQINSENEEIETNELDNTDKINELNNLMRISKRLDSYHYEILNDDCYTGMRSDINRVYDLFQ